MKYVDEKDFSEVNVFGKGNFNKDYAQYLLAIPI